MHPDRTLKVEDVPKPVAPASGGVVVEVLATRVLTYAKNVVAGKLPIYLLPEVGATAKCAPFRGPSHARFPVHPQLPTTFGPGGVGRVVSTSPDVFDLSPGDLVLVDPQMGSRQIGGNYDEILLGLTSTSGPMGQRIQKLFKDGSWAEQALMPIKSTTPLPASVLEGGLTPSHLAAASSLNLSYFGLIRAGFTPGMTVIVNGATGSFGSMACLVALGIGASKVIGVGRNPQHLEKISKKLAGYGSRFVAVSAAVDDGTDEEKLKTLTERLQKASGKNAANANTGADICIDLVGQAKSTDSTLASLRALKRGGTLVLEGSMTVPLALNYMELMLNNLVVMGNVGFEGAKGRPPLCRANFLAPHLTVHVPTHHTLHSHPSHSKQANRPRLAGHLLVPIGPGPPGDGPRCECGTARVCHADA